MINLPFAVLLSNRRYLDQVLGTDRQVFDGVRSWDELKAQRHLLPSIVINEMLDRRPRVPGVGEAAEASEAEGELGE